jgi:hypothetical protein
MQLKTSTRVSGFVNGRNQLSGLTQNHVSSNRSRKCRLSVRAAARDIVFGQDSRTAMQAGIDKLADSVGVTLGPRGKHCCQVILDQASGNDLKYQVYR